MKIKKNSDLPTLIGELNKTTVESTIFKLEQAYIMGQGENHDVPPIELANFLNTTRTLKLVMLKVLKSVKKAARKQSKTPSLVIHVS